MNEDPVHDDEKRLRLYRALRQSAGSVSSMPVLELRSYALQQHRVIEILQRRLDDIGARLQHAEDLLQMRMGK